MKKIGVSVLLVCTLLVFTVSPIFGDDHLPDSTSRQYKTFNFSNSSNVTCQVMISAMKPYIYESGFVDIGNPSANNLYYQSYTVAQEYLVNIYLINKFDYSVSLNTPYFRFNFPIYNPSTRVGGYSISEINGDIAVAPNGDIVDVYFGDTFHNNNDVNVSLMGHAYKLVSFKITSYYNYYSNNGLNYDANTSNLPFYTIDGSISITTPSTLTYSSIEYDIYDPVYNNYDTNNAVNSILDAYTSNVQGAQDLVNDTNSNDQKLDSIHQSEAQWYSQNQSAIESTGLSNFEFSGDQINGLTGVFSLFQRLWNSMGEYTFVITFTLMMSFAAFFLRHRPVKATTGNNYSRKDSNHGTSS